VQVTELGHGFWRVVIRYGFVEDPDVPKALQSIPPEILVLKPMETTFFLGRETIVATKRPGMFLWQERLFGRMIRNERTATSFFKIPPNRVVELGEQIEI
jgi:KUP system potassium uptake protein